MHFLFPHFPFTASAADTVLYNANAFSTFKDRTKAEIAEHYSMGRNAGESYDDSDRTTWYSTMPSLTSPYEPGVLTADTHTAMTESTNFLRWLVGAKPLTQQSVNSEELQAGAFIRNWDFAHAVSDANKPEDMAQSLWDFGADADHNILARGYTPRGSITGWMNEGYNLTTGKWDTIGHRMALIDFVLTSVQFGYSGSTAIGIDAAAGNTSDLPYFAYPAPGFMPMNNLVVNSAAWNIELNTKIIKVSNAANVTVTVTNLSSGDSYVCTEANDKLVAGSVLMFVQPASSGGSSRYLPGEKFQINVTGLTDVATGNEAQLTYTTEMFDVTQLADSYVTKVTAAGYWDNLVIATSNETTDNLLKIASVLPKTMTIVNENQSIASVPVSGEWVLDEANKCWLNSISDDDLPSNITDKNNICDEIRITYSTENYTGSLNFSPSLPVIGEAGSFSMWRYNISTDSAEVYKTVENGSGGYKGDLFMDTSSENFSISSNGYYIYDIDSISADDNGTYIGIYYSTSTYFTDAYLAGIKTITVEDKPISDVKLHWPDKTTYIVGEELDLTGGYFAVTYTDGSTSSIPLSNGTITGFTTDRLGQVQITLSYADGKYYSGYPIWVIEALEPVSIAEGKSLSEYNLPQGWSWANPNDILMDSANVQVIYTPQDDLYNPLTTTVMVTVIKDTNPDVNLKYGDVNGDKIIDSSDAILVLQRYAGISINSAFNITAANVNADSNIDSTDAILILQYYSGIISKFPAE